MEPAMSHLSKSRSIAGRVFLALLIAGGTLSGCTPDWATQNDADVILRITDITGSPGGDGQEDGDTLFSDVGRVVFNDNATLELDLYEKNPNEDFVAGGFNDVIVRRYTVRYVRADGRNVEGVDVPYSFSGDMNARVFAQGGTTEAVIAVVRHTAKLEPPLKNLAFIGNNVFSGGSNFIVTIAQITVFGETITGKAVSASASLEIHFADYGGNE